MPILLLFFLSGCVSRRSPQRDFEAAYATFLDGDLIRAQGQAESASRYYSRRDIIWAWKFQVLRARILAWRGMYKEALKDMDSELPAPLKSSDIDLQRQLVVGVTYAHLRRFPEAELELEQATRNCANSNSAVIGEALDAQGILMTERRYPGDLERAQDLFERSLRIAHQQADVFLQAMALSNLGYASLLQQHFDPAIDALNAASDIAQKIGARRLTENIEGNLGWAYYKTGDFVRSSEVFREAYELARQLGSKDDQVAWLTNRGLAHLNDQESSDVEKFALAKKYYSQALDLARAIDSKTEIFNAETALAVADLATEQLSSATQHNEEAIRLARIVSNRTDELYALLVTGQIAARRHDDNQAEQIFLEIANDPKVDASLKWEAQHELANLYLETHRFADADKAYQAALDEFEAERYLLYHEESKLPFLANAASLYNNYIQLLVSQGKTARALEVADYSHAQTLLEGLGVLKGKGSFVPPALHPERIARSVGGTVLFYWLGPKQSYLWAATPKQTSMFRLPAASEIAAAVQSYSKALQGYRDVLQDENSDATRLYQMLIAPAAKLIKPDSRVVVVADGALNTLNFETLLVPGHKTHFWIEDVTVRNVSSLRLLTAASSSREPRAAKLLLIGNPVTPGSEYPELPNAAHEMQNVERHFSAAEQVVYGREQATAEAYTAGKPEQFTYIHFVTHGTASRLSPLDSAIVLSKAGTQEDSFKLYARDIIQHSLHANLVSISACYGSGTRAYSGEGLVGLSWAFLRAGAHNVIGALWEVSDDSTPLLMDRLYSELKKGRSPDAALRAAKLSLLDRQDVFRKPYYWAPFQLYAGS